MTNANEWYIENVKEECDSADEFFYDQKVHTVTPTTNAHTTTNE